MDAMRRCCGEGGAMGIRELARSLGYIGEDVDLSFVLDLALADAKLSELERWSWERPHGYEVVT
jgi:hypothetical protein